MVTGSDVFPLRPRRPHGLACTGAQAEHRHGRTVTFLCRYAEPPRATLAVLGLACVLAACTAPGAARVAKLGEARTLRVGEQLAFAGGASLRFAEVRSDSRCPIGAQCIQAGEAVVAFEIDAPSEPSTVLVLSTQMLPVEARAGAWRLQLLALGREAPLAARIVMDRQ